MPYQRFFFCPSSPVECRQQATITASIHTRLGIRPRPRPGPRPQTIEQHRQEPAGSRHMVGGVNEAAVLEMFQSYRYNFRTELNIIGEDNDEINRRCAYTREHKLVAMITQ